MNAAQLRALRNAMSSRIIPCHAVSPVLGPSIVPAPAKRPPGPCHCDGERTHEPRARASARRRSLRRARAVAGQRPRALTLAGLSAAAVRDSGGCGATPRACCRGGGGAEGGGVAGAAGAAGRRCFGLAWIGIGRAASILTRMA